MFGENALTLVKELHNVVDTLPPYNVDLVQAVSSEVLTLTRSNQQLIQVNDESELSYISTIRIQHAAIQRNKRCLFAYHYHRLRRIGNMRWEFGSILPSDIKACLCNEEVQWFKDYNRILATYMRTIGEAGGVNLCVDTKPPKSLYIEVKCLLDYGKYELNNGEVVMLKCNTRYFLPHRDCEELIRQGILEHILL